MSLEEKLAIDCEKVCPRIESFIRQKTEELEREGVILGLSGGIDSAVCAYLCVRALGKDKVLGLLLPERDVSSESVEDAKLVVSKLGIKSEVEDITTILKQLGTYKLIKLPFFLGKLKGNIIKAAYQYYYKKTGQNPFASSLLGVPKNRPYADMLKAVSAFMRSKHRARALTWYKYAELNNLLVVGCCNKTEKLVGWYVKYGDAASDIDPIAGLYKTQVRQLATYLGVPKKIIAKVPTPDMLSGITDEYALGISYEKIDLILVGFEYGLAPQEITKEAGVNEKMVEYVRELNKKSEHMRQVYTPNLES